jgi:hypothetical protein
MNREMNIPVIESSTPCIGCGSKIDIYGDKRYRYRRQHDGSLKYAHYKCVENGKCKWEDL